MKMLNDPDMPGLWHDVACDDGDEAIQPELNAFLCQSNLGKELAYSSFTIYRLKTASFLL